MKSITFFLPFTSMFTRANVLAGEDSGFKAYQTVRYTLPRNAR